MKKIYFLWSLMGLPILQVGWAQQKTITGTILDETASGDEQHTAYLNAIKASFEELGLGTTEYNAYVGQTTITIDPGSGNLTKEQVMTQKYIGMFVQPEAFSDWRRTGIPVLTAVSGSEVPRRWFYPEN